MDFQSSRFCCSCYTCKLHCHVFKWSNNCTRKEGEHIMNHSLLFNILTGLVLHLWKLRKQELKISIRNAKTSDNVCLDHSLISTRWSASNFKFTLLSTVYTNFPVLLVTNKTRKMLVWIENGRRYFCNIFSFYKYFVILPILQI